MQIGLDSPTDYQIEDQNIQKLANLTFAGFFVFTAGQNVQKFANF